MSRRTLGWTLVLVVMLTQPGCGSRDPAIKTMQAYDLLAAFPRATINAPAPTYVVRGDFSVGQETLPCLFIHPTSSVQFAPVRVSAESVLVFRFGVRDEVWDKGGDGVDFTVYVQGAGPRVKVFARYADPKHNPVDRHWITSRVPLRPFAGQDIRITFATEPGPTGDTAYDWAVWGEPMIILSTK